MIRRSIAFGITCATILVVVFATNPEYLAGRLTSARRIVQLRSRLPAKQGKSSSRAVTGVASSKATNFGPDTLAYTEPKNLMTTVMGNVSQVFDVCPQSVYKGGLTKHMESLKWDQISEVLVFDASTRQQIGLAVRSLGKGGKFTYTGDEGKNVPNVYFRIKMRPYDRTVPTSISLSRSSSCFSNAAQYVHVYAAAVTDIVNAGPEAAPITAGNNVVIGTFVVRAQRSNPHLLLQVMSLRFRAELSSKVKISNVRLRTEGTEEKGECLLNSLPTILCDSIPESVGLMSGDKRFTVTADVTRTGTNGFLQLRMTDFGSVAASAQGSVRWKNDEGSFDWITPTQDPVLSTRYTD